ncbi:MAG TPA: histidine kinase dimerization/phospho-acceptor domain-containing protein [Candidatus Competibacter sp.]|nr:histidine kinase dimerization/phospho-acceptor domain-containing protein [Candidatus Competibacter sp.]
MTVTQPIAALLPDHFMDRRYLWRVFRASSFFRLILAALLLAAATLDEQNRLFGKQNPQLFSWMALGYLALALLAIAGTYWRQPRLTVQAHLQMVVDLVTLTVMINASGGITSSLNSLLITAVAASSILLPLSSALLAAALGFMLLTASWLLDQWHTVQVLARAERGPADWPNLWNRLNDANDDLVRLGVLGAALFIAAGLTYALAERARRGEALACQRTLELLEAAELSQGIIRHLQNGVVLVNPTGQVQLLNETAQEWLDCPQTVPGLPLEALSPPLARRLRDWLDDNLEHPAFRPAEHRPELIPRFTRLSGRQATSVLILLEDSQQATERLQQLKLAALGRLTAGIAHEIRNPLAAIGHAAQLLQESTGPSPNDQRLAQIVHDNVKRANRIIGDVLDLARRDQLKPERLVLGAWLENFRQEFLRGQDWPTPEWRQSVEPAELAVMFDPHQLWQVLWNLCANACQHGSRVGETPQIELRAGLDDGRARPFLDVRDTGAGVAADNVAKLFEPFFTTRTKGTGLGLYLARELCEANRAQLQYRPPPEGGGCFRITFTAAHFVSETN